jgi:hypothetical protein
MNDYEEYENKCKSIRAENRKLLDDFRVWLQNKKLVDNTINNHVLIVDFYINEFLLYSEACESKNGYDLIGMFLGDWVIRKTMWASCANIKTNAASLKKFYTFMFEKGYISSGNLEELKEMIKEQMPDWLEELKRYDNSLLEEY